MTNCQDSSLCATGCGFFGNPTQHNLCSKCFKDFLKKKTVLQQEQEQEQPTTTTVTNNNDGVMKVSDESGSGAKKTTMKERKNRCKSCSKKVGLTGFECKCREVYCGSQRYPEEHSCTFDFKTVQLQGLSKTLYSAAECKADRVHNRI